MVKLLSSGLMLVLFLALMQPQAGYGRGPGLTLPADSVPPVRTNPAEKPAEPLLPEIKEVPKSRRLIKPMAIPAPLPVKTIKIIKPKIITRPIIGIGG
ncbi:hypothetical protein [Chitinophaga vietnamensis]|uniref:hypothetical protein n=1 Tax=Chitinophaga vietnamensis TaxID=2593957 RepID=UPI00117874F3|nr:hypothetical protein [Chitinophaga vietnamensis]